MLFSGISDRTKYGVGDDVVTDLRDREDRNIV